MSNTQLAEIGRKLDKLIALTAIQGKDKNKQTKILKSLGLTYKEISALTGVPEGTLKSRDHKVRKKIEKGENIDKQADLPEN